MLKYPSMAPSLGTEPEWSAVNKVNVGEEEANRLASERDEKGGAMFREYAKPRARVVEIVERRRDNYP